MGNLRNQEYIDAFAAHPRGLRQSLRLTLEQIGDRADKEITAVTLIENGKTNVTISSLLAMANALGVSPKELLDFEFDQ